MGGDFELLGYLLVGVIALALVVPIALMVLRRLNETWLDADWRAARRQRQQDRIESIIVAKSDPILSSIFWGVLIEAAFTLFGAAIGAFVYLPGPLDGWFIFSMMLFGGGGAFLGLFANTVMLLIRSQE